MIFVCIFGMAPKASAQLRCPLFPICTFTGKFLTFKPECTNGDLIEVRTPIPITLLAPFIPITPIVPVIKLWGPITDATAVGGFVFGGVCEHGSEPPTPVFGILIQIGTSAIPTPWYFPELLP